MTDYEKARASKRIKELRESTQDEKGKYLSHTRLEKELLNIEGVSVSKDSLMNYEADENRSKFGAVAGMSVETLTALADFYDVSTDYVLGRTDVKSRTPEIAMICDYTGLSEDAVNQLRQLRFLYGQAGRTDCFLTTFINELTLSFEELNQITGDMYQEALATSVSRDRGDAAPPLTALEWCATRPDVQENWATGLVTIPSKDAQSWYRDRVTKTISKIAERVIECVINHRIKTSKTNEVIQEGDTNCKL